MTEHIIRKHTLEGMTKAEIIDSLEQTALSEEEREVMELIYIQRKPLDYIADITGYSISGVKKIHSRILKRMNHLR